MSIGTHNGPPKRFAIPADHRALNPKDNPNPVMSQITAACLSSHATRMAGKPRPAKPVTEFVNGKKSRQAKRSA